MASIELGKSVEEVAREFKRLSTSELVAQQICHASVIHALEYLLQTGLTVPRARSMIQQVHETQATLVQIAKTRPNCYLAFNQPVFDIPPADRTKTFPPELRSIQRFLTACRRLEAYVGIPCTVEDFNVIAGLLRRFGASAWLEIRDDEQTPGTCSVCGCSETDACPPGCAWATTRMTLCTTCANA